MEYRGMQNILCCKIFPTDNAIFNSIVENNQNENADL